LRNRGERIHLYYSQSLDILAIGPLNIKIWSLAATPPPLLISANKKAAGFTAAVNQAYFLEKCW